MGRAERDLDLERIRLPKFSGHKTRFDNFGYLSEVSWVGRMNQQSIRWKTDEGVSRLEFSEEAYEEEKGILKCRFSGERRPLQSY